ncbi:hypothetical protein D3C84_726130 [compost metagenome]
MGQAYEVLAETAPGLPIQGHVIEVPRDVAQADRVAGTVVPDGFTKRRVKRIETSQHAEHMDTTIRTVIAVERVTSAVVTDDTNGRKGNLLVKKRNIVLIEGEAL